MRLVLLLIHVLHTGCARQRFEEMGTQHNKLGQVAGGVWRVRDFMQHKMPRENVCSIESRPSYTWA